MQMAEQMVGIIRSHSEGRGAQPSLGDYHFLQYIILPLYDVLRAVQGPPRRAAMAGGACGPEQGWDGMGFRKRMLGSTEPHIGRGGTTTT